MKEEKLTSEEKLNIQLRNFTIEEIESYLELLLTKAIESVEKEDLATYGSIEKTLNSSLIIFSSKVRNFHIIYNRIKLKVANKFLKKYLNSNITILDEVGTAGAFLTVEEAEKITNQDIVEFLGGLPNEKIHCSVMGKEALEDAIAKYKGIEKTVEEDNDVICQCFNVREQELRELVREKGVTDIYEASQYSKVGSACGKCREEASAIILDELKLKNSNPDKMTKTQLVLKINKVLEGYISEHLRKDGGDIELINVKKNKVFVKLCGVCGKCAMSSHTLKNFVEKTLKEQVSQDLEVVAVD